MTNGDVLIKRLDDVSCFLAVVSAFFSGQGILIRVLPPSSFVAIVNVIGFLFLR